SCSQGPQYSFEALHFAWYNRHGTRGYQVCSESHPHLIRKADRSRTNYSQMLPYPSADMHKHERVYHNLEHIFAEVFGWIREQIQILFPQEYAEMSVDAEVLPGNAGSIVHPFLSLVINLNVATSAHRDSMDKTLCVVLPIGDF
ncbi:uncharacterized protein B0H18DRAFT_838686, partial [Fomitopsis serialis]|uniref:uncharacterized protein n=1 Tax=Fomitopsis serialis TaxID=139415 RepID=UPI002008DC85